MNENNTERPVITMGDESYPDKLKRIINPPKQLYYEGDLSVLSKPCVAVVGSRKASEYGRWVALNLGRRLSECGAVVISGMAEGIDSFAHRGALEGPTPTVAVIGNGLDICFPKMNDPLRRRILKEGLLLSEYEDGVHGSRYTFPARNRIISGLCIATVVVEAGISSGALITARHAAEQGRDVYAVPGNINRGLSAGCNKLIRNGVTPLFSFDDLAEHIGLRAPGGSAQKRAPKKARVPDGLGKDEIILLEMACDSGGMTADEAAAATGLSVSGVASTATVLEMKGLISFNSGRITPV